MPARRMERFVQGPALQRANPFDGPFKTPSRQSQRIVERIPPSPQSSFFSSRSSISTISTTDSIRSVTFVETSMNQQQEIPSLSEEEVGKTWWTKEDIEQFQVTADKLVKSLQKRPNMAASKSTSNSSSSSYTDVLNRIYNQCCSKNGDSNQDDCDELIKWQRNSHGRRGLETKILATMNEDRTYRKEAVVHAVLTLQGNDTIDPVIKAESIRRCSERMTQPARSFARVIALADEGCQKPIEKRSRIRVARTTRMTIM